MRIQKILAGTTTKFPITVRRLDPDAENNDEVIFRTTCVSLRTVRCHATLLGFQDYCL